MQYKIKDGTHTTLADVVVVCTGTLPLLLLWPVFVTGILKCSNRVCDDMGAMFYKLITNIIQVSLALTL